MKKKSFRLMILIGITFLNSEVISQVLVTPANFSANGWEEAQVIRPDPLDPKKDVRSLSTDFIYFTCGPDNPFTQFTPGSLFISFPIAANPTLYRVILGNNLYQDKKLKDIVELSYYTYTVKTAANTPCSDGYALDSPVAPVLLLQIDMDGAGPGTVINNINFIPVLQDPPVGGGKYPVIAGKWQQWNTLSGKWRFFNRSTATTSDMAMADFLQDYPDATIVNTEFSKPMGGAGIRFLVGSVQPPGGKPFYDNYTGYIDGFTIKDNTKPLADIYNFEDKPSIANSEQSICAGSYILIGNPPVVCNSYLWTSDKNDLMPEQIHNAVITVSPSTTTTYTLKETLPNGCVNTTVVKVNIYGSWMYCLWEWFINLPRFYKIPIIVLLGFAGGAFIYLVYRVGKWIIEKLPKDPDHPERRNN